MYCQNTVSQGFTHGFQIGYVADITDAASKTQPSTRPQRQFASRSAVGTIATSHSGASQNTQRGALHVPP
jgi:hypothetical protein